MNVKQMNFNLIQEGATAGSLAAAGLCHVWQFFIPTSKILVRLKTPDGGETQEVGRQEKGWSH